MIFSSRISQFLVLLFFLIPVFSCNHTTNEDSLASNNKKDISEVEDFDSFYSHFHSDSAFQISRILFPIDGYEIDSDYNPDSLDNDFKWDKEDWKIHRLLDLSEFKIEKEVYGDSIVEKIYIENSGFEVIRKFKLQNKVWYLYFYGSQNL